MVHARRKLQALRLKGLGKLPPFQLFGHFGYVSLSMPAWLWLAQSPQYHNQGQAEMLHHSPLQNIQLRISMAVPTMPQKSIKSVMRMPSQASGTMKDPTQSDK